MNALPAGNFHNRVVLTRSRRADVRDVAVRWIRLLTHEAVGVLEEQRFVGIFELGWVGLIVEVHQKVLDHALQDGSVLFGRLRRRLVLRWGGLWGGRVVDLKRAWLDWIREFGWPLKDPTELW